MTDNGTGGIPHQSSDSLLKRLFAPNGAPPNGPEPPAWATGSMGFGDNGHRGAYGEEFIRMLATAANLDVTRKERDRVGVDWQLGYAGRRGTAGFRPLRHRSSARRRRTSTATTSTTSSR